MTGEGEEMTRRAIEWRKNRKRTEKECNRDREGKQRIKKIVAEYNIKEEKDGKDKGSDKKRSEVNTEGKDERAGNR